MKCVFSTVVSLIIAEQILRDFFAFILGRVIAAPTLNELRRRLHYTGLQRSVVIFIPDSSTVYTIPQLIRHAPRSENHSALEVIQKVIRYLLEQCKQ